MRISLIILSILTACFKDETVSGQTENADVWLLKTLNETNVTTRITISFPEQGRIAGQAPCNRYSGSQTVPLPWFKVTELAASKMACPALDLEAQYLNLLQDMTTAEITGNMLILRSDEGKSLTFKNN